MTEEEAINTLIGLPETERSRGRSNASMFLDGLDRTQHRGLLRRAEELCRTGVIHIRVPAPFGLHHTTPLSPGWRECVYCRQMVDVNGTHVCPWSDRE